VKRVQQFLQPEVLALICRHVRHRGLRLCRRHLTNKRSIVPSQWEGLAYIQESKVSTNSVIQDRFRLVGCGC
jgi:acetolactate synthase regulatory subunit